MNSKAVNWKPLLTYGVILLLVLILALLLPPEYSVLLFGAVVIISIGVGLGDRSGKISARLNGWADWLFRAPNPPESALPADQASGTATAAPAALRPVGGFKFLTWQIHINVQEPLDARSQSMLQVWRSFLLVLPLIPFALGTAHFLNLARAQIESITATNFGHFGYTLDDAYIQMAMAKNVAFHNTWGITQYEFASSSSSPLLVAVMSTIYRVVGNQELVPLILNIVCVILLFALMCFTLQRRGVSPLYVLFVPLGLLLATPFVSIVFTGMEHIMHALFVILFLYLLLDLYTDSPVAPVRIGFTAIAAGLMVATRYESLFLLAPACVLLLLRGRFVRALIVGIGGALPVLVYGIISKSNGWEFLSTSLLLKTGTIEYDSLEKLIGLLQWSVVRLMEKPPLLLLLLFMLMALLVRQYLHPNFWNDRPSIALLLVAIAIFAHQALVPTTIFNRYSAYLFVGAYYVLALSIYDLDPRKLLQFRFQRFPTYGVIPVLMLVFLFAGQLNVTDQDHWAIPAASRNIYSQQYHMGQFVHTYYDDHAVAVNDIGAVSYLTNAHIVDLWGLGTKEVSDARLHGSYDLQFIKHITAEKNVKIAMIYASWFPGLIPEDWVAVGTWEVNNNVVLGDIIVTFYATHAEDAPELATNLQEFSPNLMDDTTFELLYEPPA